MNRALIFDLATARFVQQREDALFLGPPGTGKSHLAHAIGRAAIQQGYRVTYREAHTLLEGIGSVRPRRQNSTRKPTCATRGSRTAITWPKSSLNRLKFVTGCAFRAL